MINNLDVAQLKRHASPRTRHEMDLPSPVHRSLYRNSIDDCGLQEPISSSRFAGCCWTLRILDDGDVHEYIVLNMAVVHPGSEVLLVDHVLGPWVPAVEVKWYCRTLEFTPPSPRIFFYSLEDYGPSALRRQTQGTSSIRQSLSWFIWNKHD